MAQVLNAAVTDPTGNKVYVSGASPTDVNTTAARINPNAGQVVNPDMLGTQPLNLAPATNAPVPPIANLPGSAAAPTPTTPTTPGAGQTNTFTDKLSGLVAKFTGKAADTKIAEDTAVNPLENQKAQLGAQLKRLQADDIAQQEMATSRPGDTRETGSIAAQQVSRTNSIQGLLLQSRIDSLSGDIASAKKNADTAIESKYAQIQQDIQIERNNIYNNWSTFSAAEKKKYAATLVQIDADDQFAKQNVEDEKAIQSLASIALANNPNNPSVMLAVQKANETGNILEATKLLAPFQKDPQSVLLQAGQLQAQRDAHALAVANVIKLNAETAALKPLQAPTPETIPYINAFSNATAGMGAQAANQAKAIFNGYINKGDLVGAKTFIVRTAMANAPADQQNQAIGRTQALKAMDDIQTLLSQAKAKGADTNLLTGSLVNAANKLGTSTNTDLSYIGSRILQALITYRKAMTGVAFGPQEAKDYSKIFPDYTNVDGLNTAKISALRDSLNANNSATLGFYLGSENYDALFGAAGPGTLPSDQGAPAVKDGMTHTYNNVLYKVVNGVWTPSK